MQYVLAVTLPPHSFLFYKLSTKYLFPSNRGFVWIEIIALEILIFFPLEFLFNNPSLGECEYTLEAKRKMSFTSKCGKHFGPRDCYIKS